MSARNLSTLLFLLCTGAVFSQIQGNGGMPKAKKDLQLTEIPTLFFDQPNILALQEEDKIVDAEKSGPWRFGYNNETNITMNNAGVWDELPNGGNVWRVKINCKKAKTVNLTLENVRIPQGNGLFVYDEDKSFILGEFTENHLYEGNLGTELVPGNTVIVEYYLAPGNLVSEASLNIVKVTHGYRTADEFSAKAFGSSGNCNMNVNCPDGAPWQAQKRAAVMLVSGSNGFCSGSLINNTLNDGKPYVLTANHCYSNPVSWIFRFKWESSQCANPVSSPSFQSLSGAVLRSRRTPTDFCLVEITGGLVGGTVPSSFDPYFSGWDNSGSVPSVTVSIHHPAGDIKKIAFDDNPAAAVQAMGSSEPMSCWEVVWDRNTTTEGGSSGSPLYDGAGKIIGQLWGGFASCSNLSGVDYYGRFSGSWEPVGSNSTNQLKHWLDPNSSNIASINGFDPLTPTTPDNAGITSVISPSGSYCGPSASFEPQFILTNFGNNTLNSVMINYSVNSGVNQVFSWTGNLAPGASVTLTMPSMTGVNGNNSFYVTTSLPNGNADTGPTNDDMTSTFTVNTNGQKVTLALTTDCYPEETSWMLLNPNNTVIHSVPINTLPSETLVEYEWCLTGGCYTFVISDSYGDGMTSTDCNFDGSYEITNEASEVLASILEPNFGTSENNVFCISGLGTTELTNFDFYVFPNPSNGEVSIRFTEQIGAYTVAIVDALGREVYTAVRSDVESIHDISGVASGTYTLQIRTEDFHRTQRIIVTK